MKIRTSTLLVATLLMALAIGTADNAYAQKKNTKNKKKTEQKDKAKTDDKTDSIATAKKDSAEVVFENDVIDKVVREEAQAPKGPVMLTDPKRNLPSKMWYGVHFSDAYVKKPSVTLDSIPDEIKITLVKDYSEFCFPMKNVITSPYGWRERWDRPHRGVDIALNTGDPVKCAFNGVVRIAKSFGGYGNLVVVRHYNGLETVYGHLSRINVKQMQVVKAGDVIGYGGSTGHSTGPHLHFEVRFQYEPFDPEWILDFKNYSLRTRVLYLNKTYFGISKPRNKKDIAYKADKSIVKERPLTPATNAPKKKTEYYTVKRGDTWEKVAKKYKVSETQLKSMNPSITGKLPVGEDIRVH